MAIDITVQDASEGLSVTLQGGADTRVVSTTTTQTSAYTANNFEAVLADASGGAFDVTLPGPSTSVHVIVKKTDSSSNAVTLVTPGSESIDGQSSLSITNQYTSRTIISDGTDYFIA